MKIPARLRKNKALILALILLTPVFLCGLTLVIYLVFPPPQIDILVMGVDSREGEGWLARADSIILVGINPSQLRVSLLSIPRDLSVDTPGYGMQRINAVNMLGEMEQEGRGPALLSEAVKQSFGVSMERAVRLNFNGFVELVDAVGGLTIDVERAIVDDLYPTADGGVTSIRFESGFQHMDGERALIYARTRHSDDDYRRAERQQQVVSALLGRLANPVYWPAALSVLNRSVDTNLTLWDMLRLAPPVILNRGRFEQFVIDRDKITATAEGVAIPDYDQLTPWLVGRFD
jgi:polyisoprenyl-teichoic acid--peptidoglycan teichoic acid transferase